MTNLKRSLLCTLPVALGAGLVFHTLFNLLMVGAIRSNTANSDGDAAGILVGFLFAAAFVYVFMIVAIMISSLMAWLGLRLLRVPHAGKIAVLAAPILCVTWYLFIGQSLLEVAPTWMFSAISFVVVYTSLLVILSRRDA